MNAKKCDRCGVFFKLDDEYLELRAKPMVDKFEPMFGNEYDLCKICQEEFYNFMNNYKEVIKDEKE